MTDRERWTVYPLLFLTLGVALRDKIFNVVNVDDVQCQRLIVTDRTGKQQVAVSSNASGGFVRTYGNKNGLAVELGNTDRLAGLIFIDGSRVHLVSGSVYASPEKVRNPQPPEPGPRDENGENAPEEKQPPPADPASES